MIGRQCSIFFKNKLYTTFKDEVYDLEPTFLPILLKLINIQDNDTREVHLRTLGVFCQRFGGKEFVEQHTEGLTATKKKLIEEGAASVQPSKYDKSDRPAPVKAKPIVEKKETPKETTA